MNRGEAISGGVFIAIGLAVASQAMKMSYLIDSVPGPGFLPTWIAAGLIFCGAVIVFKAFRRTEPVLVVVDEDAPAWPDKAGKRRVALVLACLAVALVLLNTLGFFITVTLFVGTVIFGLGVRSWPMLLGVPILAAGILYLVFAIWLSVPLPDGILTGLKST